MINSDIEMVADRISLPGETIADILEERGWTQAEFAERMGYTKKHINLLIKGKASITEDTALRLERVVGSTARFWLTRESQYREALARETELAELASSVRWLEELPLGEMVKFKWVEKRNNKILQVSECLQYFGVASVGAWREKYGKVLLAYRVSKNADKQPGAVSAWLRQGEKQADTIATMPFNKIEFQKTLAVLRQLVVEPDPAIFLPRLVSECAKCGVAVVVERAPKGSPVCGIARWLTPEKALIMLSFRYKSNDQFWFSFFHEASHLILHGKKMLFLEGLKNDLDGKSEDEADKFAADLLIPPKYLSKLRTLPHTDAAIIDFSKKLGAAPGIIVERMEKEGILAWNTALNKLKVFYTWKDE